MAPAIDLDATVARLRALPEPQKISLSGALAVLMGRRSHGWNLEAVQPGSDGPPFCAWLLEHIMVVLLQLPAELLEGLKPLTEPQASVWGEAIPQEAMPPLADPAPFLERLPASASAREELMHGLLLLVATGTSGGGEAPKYAGYDARSRQLLQDMARRNGKPADHANRCHHIKRPPLERNTRGHRTAGTSGKSDKSQFSEQESRFDPRNQGE